MSNHLFICPNLENLKEERNRIIDSVKESGYALIRGLSDSSKIEQIKEKIFKYANFKEHLASQGVSPAEIRKNMSKWSIGGHSQSQAGIARFMLTIYNPLFDKDIFNLHATFNKMLEVRDILASRELLTDGKLLPTHFNACRIQIYPAGGGFLSGHIDSRASSNIYESVVQENKAYIQLVLLLTEKGIDYKNGGAFVRVKSEVIDSEKDSVAGDILVYDGATYHGVADIDATLPFDAENLRGRAVALATIYNKA